MPRFKFYNPAKHKPLEKSIEAAIGRYAVSKGCLWWKFVSPNNASVPDRVVVTPNGVVAFMEIKRPGNKVTPATGSPDGRRLFFRGHRSTTDLIVDSMFAEFEEFTDKHHIPYDERFDFGVGCGESCEIGSDERYGVEVADEEEIADEDPLATKEVTKL